MAYLVRGELSLLPLVISAPEAKPLMPSRTLSCVSYRVHVMIV